MPKLCSNANETSHVVHWNGSSPCDWAYDAQKMSWTHLKSFAGLDSDIPSEKPSNLSYWIYIALFVLSLNEKLNMVYVIIITR